MAHHPFKQGPRLPRNTFATKIIPRIEFLEGRTLLNGQGLGPFQDFSVRATQAGQDISSILIVKFASAAAVQDLAQLAPLGSPVVMNLGNQPTLMQVRFPDPHSLENALAAFQASSSVVYAEPLQQYSVSIDPNVYLPDDPKFSSLYGLDNTGQTGGTADADIDAPEAWDVFTGSTSVIVANIDSGVDYNHPDLYKNIWINQAEIPGSRLANLSDLDGDGLITFWDLNDPSNQGTGKITDVNGDGRIDAGDILAPMNKNAQGNDLGTGGWSDGISQDGDTAHLDNLVGWNFVTNTNKPFDDHGHGTHTAGTIGAMGNNGAGVVGVNWKTQIMVLKFIDKFGNGSSYNAAQAIDYAVAHGAAVTSNSWGGGGYSQTLYNSIQQAGQAGQIFVAAAGNKSTNNDNSAFYPASYNLDNIISVAATDNKDIRASFSNYGATTVDLAAPGVAILSTRPGNAYANLSGTSMAAPHVAGVVALVRGLHPDWDYDQVIDRILDTVDPVASLSGKTVSGGRLNAAAAVDLTVDDNPGSGIDIAMIGASAGGFNTVTLAYEIAGAAVAPFQIGFYRSNDTNPGGDLLLSALVLQDPADLSVGAHTKTYTIGASTGQVALPGAGLPEIGGDYAILVLADRLRAVAEDDEDPFAEDNVVLLSGAYHSSAGSVYVHGDQGNNSISVTAGNGYLDLNLDGTIYSYLETDVASFRIRGHDGDDALSGASGADLLWGGDGDDTFNGKLGNDFIDGGTGVNFWTFEGSAAAEFLDVSWDSAASQLVANRRQTSGGIPLEIDRAAQIQILTVLGNDGHDQMDFTALDTSALQASGLTSFTADGGNDNDTLLGSAGNDQLIAGGGIDTLLGGDGDDTIALATSQSAGTTIDGGNGNDTLVGADAVNTWSLSAANAGTLNGWSFTAIENLTGGTKNDLFQVGALGSLTGAAIGDAGTNTLDYFSFGATLTINLQSRTATTLGSFASIGVLIGTAFTGDTLIGADTSNTWNVTGANSGALGTTFTFSGMENLTGGTDADSFKFGPGGSVQGLVDGKNGTDKLDYSTYGSAVTINLQSLTAIATGAIASIENFVGSSAADSLVASNAANLWQITSNNGGKVGSAYFFSFENLTGGASADLYKFSNGKKVTGIIDGGGGGNTLDYSLYSTAITVDLSTGAATGVTGGVVAIANITGGSSTDNLAGDAGDNILRGNAGDDSLSGGTGGNDILVGGAGIDTLTGSTGRSLLIGGTGADSITAGSGEDIVIGGSTTFDNQVAALISLLNEWKRVDLDYQARIDHLTGTTSGGYNGTNYLKSSTVLNDAAADTLLGGDGDDWFWANLPQDSLADRLTSERVN